MHFIISLCYFSFIRYGEVPPPPHDYQLPIPDDDTVFHYKFVKEVSYESS